MSSISRAYRCSHAKIGRRMHARGCPRQPRMARGCARLGQLELAGAGRGHHAFSQRERPVRRRAAPRHRHRGACERPREGGGGRHGEVRGGGRLVGADRRRAYGGRPLRPVLPASVERGRAPWRSRRARRTAREGGHLGPAIERTATSAFRRPPRGRAARLRRPADDARAARLPATRGRANGSGTRRRPHRPGGAGWLRGRARICPTRPEARRGHGHAAQSPAPRKRPCPPASGGAGRTRISPSCPARPGARGAIAGRGSLAAGRGPLVRQAARRRSSAPRCSAVPRGPRRPRRGLAAGMRRHCPCGTRDHRAASREAWFAQPLPGAAGAASARGARFATGAARGSGGSSEGGRRHSIKSPS
jgi:hypothetical protein